MPDRNYLDDLAAALNPATYALITHVAGLAAQEGCCAYLVGGPVRDLLLGVPQSDIDVVFDGPAIPLARRLASDLGGHAIVHRRFGTVKWLLNDPAYPPRHELTRAEGLPPFLDLISARRERYAHPAALPDVTFSDMRDDLFRRDFTINTLAIALNGANKGELLDLYGGLDDLRAGRVRVLHDLSFRDDPTRIFRALRFKERLRFTFDPHTRRLLRAAVPSIAQLTPDRARHEMVLVLAEKRTVGILDIMARWRILRLVFPGVEWGGEQRERVAALKAEGEEDPLTLLAAVLWGASVPVVDAVSERLGFPNAWHEPLRALAMLQSDPHLTSPVLTKSELFFRLRGEDEAVLGWMTRLSDNPVVCERLASFLNDLRYRELTVSGDDLIAFGLPPGPRYHVILDRVRAALMDSDAPEYLNQFALLTDLVRQERAVPAPRTAT